MRTGNVHIFGENIPPNQTSSSFHNGEENQTSGPVIDGEYETVIPESDPLDKKQPDLQNKKKTSPWAGNS